MSENYIQMIKEDKVYPIIRCKEASQAVEISKALVEGGVRVLEINVENPSIYKAIEEVSKFANVCAGGIITSLQADAAFESGAKLIASPIFQMNMVRISKNKRIPFIAGASTANEAYNAWKSRIPVIKLFPAKSMGQVEYLEDLLRPMPFLNLMPSGGLSIEDFVDYLKAGAVAVGIGRSLYRNASLKEITERARYAVSQLNH